MNWATMRTWFAALAGAAWGWLRAGTKLLTALVGVVIAVELVMVGCSWIFFFAEQLLPQRTELPQEAARQQTSAADLSVKNWVLNCIGARSVQELPETLQAYFRPAYFRDVFFCFR